ncbi:RNHCP domain-containing protein [Sporosarcina sp. Te-1]|uniref:RNHCP domain-containing protein n=1 Tax=Sporosarcina sp. Te-1 TaxID=2818390 RepID=UPI001A9DE8AC|nr:RNHCP domain-containing protein [Sporosarcina sp. Te-1]QTD41904.1 RNHCP domain-containing protein [Sporosarcina sp. Te-1]
MGRKKENAGFICEKCGETISPLTNGSYRNHCPYCLYSKHLDDKPGDRASDCLGLMKPIGWDYSAKKGYQLIHQCEKCGKIGKNKIARFTVQEDEWISFTERLNTF